jgi:uncharacterized protein (TIGR00270 family)
MKRKNVTEDCEMCSTPLSTPITIKVEGALLRVCHKCSQFGNVVSKPRTPVGQKRVMAPKGSQTGKRTIPTRPRKSIKSSNADKILLGNYGEEVRLARMKRKWTQEELAKVSGVAIPLIRNIEAQKIQPTDDTIRKLERELDIELFYTPEEELQHQDSGKSKGTTLGDIVKITRLDRD